MIKGLFITGTDTGIGKTMVAAGVLRFLRTEGIDAIPMKPVQTGSGWHDGVLRSPDLRFSIEAADMFPDSEDMPFMAPYQYEPACSPHLAGRMVASYPSVPHIVTCAETLLRRHSFVVVEGAGGVMVPLDESTTSLELMTELDFPVLLVARAGLGTINHTLLSLKILRSEGLNVLGVVFCATEPISEEDAFIRADNPSTIESFGATRTLGNIRYMPFVNATSQPMSEDFNADTRAMQLTLGALVS